MELTVAQKEELIYEMKSLMTGHAIGDALGVPVEFYSRKTLMETPVTDMIGYGVHDKPPGTWSDDTSMTICLNESLCRLKKINYHDIMNNFILWINEGKFTPDNNHAFGIGRTCYKAIYQYVKTDGESILKGCCGIRDNGNGSLMRIAPICVYLRHKHYGEINSLEIIHNISALTHSHEISKIACGIYYFIVKGIIDDLKRNNIKNTIHKSLEEARDYYLDKEEFNTHVKYYDRLFKKDFCLTPLDEIMSSGYVIDSLESAVWCLENSNNYEGSVLKAINLGGDTDTIGAITGGIAGLYYGYKAIPQKWIDVLRGKEVLNNYINYIS